MRYADQVSWLFLKIRILLRTHFGSKNVLLLKPWTVVSRKADGVTLTHNCLEEQKMFLGYFHNYSWGLKELGYYWPWHFSSGKHSVFDLYYSYSVFIFRSSWNNLTISFYNISVGPKLFSNKLFVWKFCSYPCKLKWVGYIRSWKFGSRTLFVYDPNKS